MNIADRPYKSSRALPTPAQDFTGRILMVLERGTLYPTPWMSCNGYWQPLGYGYRGAFSGLPAAAQCAIGTLALIDETPVAGLTRIPTAAGSTLKMNLVELIVKYASDGVTKQWRPRGQQMCFSHYGNPASATYVAPAATAVISEIGVFPANFLNVVGLELFAEVVTGRGNVATGTATVALTLGPTTNTIGSTLSVIAGTTASTNNAANIEAKMTVRSSASQTVNYTLAPMANSNVASNLAITNDLTVQQILQVSVSAATISDNFNVISAHIGIR